MANQQAALAVLGTRSMNLLGLQARAFAQNDPTGSNRLNQDLGKAASRKQGPRRQAVPTAKLSREEQDQVALENDPFCKEFARDLGDPTANWELTKALGRGYLFKIHHDPTESEAIQTRNQQIQLNDAMKKFMVGLQMRE